MLEKAHIKSVLAGLCAVSVAHSSVAGNFLPLSQTPPGASFMGPAPNVIISVDDSGSMGAVGINALREALKETFRPENVPDGSIRLAFQSLNQCNAIPSAAPGCDNQNYMQLLEGKFDPTDNSSRGRFLRWLNYLSALNATPTHTALRNAGEYLKVTGANSPWNATPGKPDNAPLACRKAYHVLMTDGGWNTWNTVPTLDNNPALASVYNNTIDNADGTAKVLPDGTHYDPTSGETRVYADPWGRQAVNGTSFGWWWQGDSGYSYGSKANCEQNTTNCKYIQDLGWRAVVPTLSDMAFHYWSTDLQPSIGNKVKPHITRAGTETITADNQTQTLSEYWNPKNNPATWQHMVNYTIGYNAAATWPAMGTDPVFGSNTFDGDYARLVVGTRKWQNPVQPPTNVYGNGTWPAYYLNHGYTQMYPNPNGAYVYQEDVRQQEMWHLALNSRGKFVPARTPADLVNAFKDLLTSIVADNSRTTSSYASASSSISTAGTAAYLSFYDANGWRGGVQSLHVAQNTAALTPNPAWGMDSNNQPLSTAHKLDALSPSDIAARLVLTHDASQGIPFLYTHLTAAQQALLSRASATSATTDALGEQRVNFVRGDRSAEGSSFRSRQSRQGDIVNSSIWYTGAPTQSYNFSSYNRFAQKHRTRTPMLYVGGNDGMLHGFSTLNGAEKLAYVPQGLIPFLPNLSNAAYNHRYFVDGSPFTGDVFLNTGNGNEEDQWRTMLVGSLGAGGKGYFVLDVTQPGSTSASGVASNFHNDNAATLVVMDKTDGSDADIGYLLGDSVVNEYNSQVSAQIAKLNNGRWAVILGNGYNSTNEQPVLLIQYLDGDRSLLKLSAATQGPEAAANGLSTPRLVDVNGDGTPDVVYAGDLRGNLWKFQIASATSSNWGVAFNGSPLYTAAAPTNGNISQRQPITTAPLVRMGSSVAGLMVAFGTGRNVTAADTTNTHTQSFYSIVDSTRYEVQTTGSDTGRVRELASATSGVVGTGRQALVERSFNATPIAGANASQDQTFWNMGGQATLDYAAGKKGWFLDLPESGERVVRAPRFYAAGGNVIEILSDSPQAAEDLTIERCEPSTTPPKAWRTLLGIEFGNRPTQQLLDPSGDGVYNAVSDSNANRMATGTKGISLRAKGDRVNIGNISTERTNDLARPYTSLNWRQMQ